MTAGDAGGVEDADTAGKDDGGGLKGLYENVGDLLLEQFGIGGGGLTSHGEVLAIAVDFRAHVVRTLKGPHTRRDPFSLPIRTSMKLSQRPRLRGFSG